MRANTVAGSVAVPVSDELPVAVTPCGSVLRTLMTRLSLTVTPASTRSPVSRLTPPLAVNDQMRPSPMLAVLGRPRPSMKSAWMSFQQGHGEAGGEIERPGHALAVARAQLGRLDAVVVEPAHEVLLHRQPAGAKPCW